MGRRHHLLPVPVHLRQHLAPAGHPTRQLDNVVGFLMWAVDDDHSRWIGGLVVDAAHQRHGVGRAAVIEAIRLLVAQPDCAGIALSCHPANHAARSLYAALGFSDTGETAEDGELVSRLRLGDAQTLAGIEGPDEP